MKHIMVRVPYSADSAFTLIASDDNLPLLSKTESSHTRDQEKQGNLERENNKPYPGLQSLGGIMFTLNKEEFRTHISDMRELRSPFVRGSVTASGEGKKKLDEEMNREKEKMYVRVQSMGGVMFTC